MNYIINNTYYLDKCLINLISSLIHAYNNPVLITNLNNCDLLTTTFVKYVFLIYNDCQDQFSRHAKI